MAFVRRFGWGACVVGLTFSCGGDDKPTQHEPAAGAGGGAGTAGKPAASGGAASGGAATGGTSGDGGRGGQGGNAVDPDAGGAAGEESGGAGGEPPVFECPPLVAAPAKFKTVSGFTSSEDFAFDELGNYVGVDEDGNLVRITKEGKKSLWAPGMGQTAGMAMLPDGSIVIADVGNGAVKRVFPNGASQVVLGGLLYPNGLDVGPDGFIYVAENNAGRVRRIDPETGAFTIVALGLYGPNGVAFSNDPHLMYVGSFEGSGVYRVEIPTPGALGKASVLARPSGSHLPDPVLACPDQQVGKDCETTILHEAGKCQKLGNVVDCVAENECSGAAEGSPCKVGDVQGKCSGGTCLVPEECEGKPDNTPCKNAFGDQGTCNFGFCSVADPCEKAADGDECKVWGSAGVCDDGYCAPTGPCTGKKVGDTCTEGGTEGKCQGDDGFLWCEFPDPCAENPDDCEGGPGGIDGLGVDACGYVYASEFQRGYVWRISPAGELEKLADLPSQWIPNIKWGRGLGGFERDTMFVADRDEGRLFAVEVGRPGATEYYDLVKQ